MMGSNEIEQIVRDCSAEIFGAQFHFDFAVDLYRAPDIMRFFITVRTKSVIARDGDKVLDLNIARAMSMGNLQRPEHILEILLDLFREFMVHEATETFNYQGKQFRNPHKSIDVNTKKV